MIQIKKFTPETHKLKCLIYGKSGSGKTSLGATAPKPLFICAENGLASIANKNPNYIEIKTLEDLKEVYEMLRKGVDYETIVIDSLSEIGKVIKDNLTKENSFDMNMRKRGQYADELMQIIRKMTQKLSYNIVCIIHDKEIKNDEGIVTGYNIAVQGSAKDEVPRYFDVIAYTYIKDGQHRATCEPSEKLITKDRLNCLPKDLPLDISDRLKTFKESVKVGKTKIIKEVKDVLIEIKNQIENKVKEGENKKVIIEKLNASDKYNKEEKKELVEYIKQLSN